MRFQLLVLSLLVVGVTGRRGANPPAAPPKQHRQVFTQWGYPYGWGLPVPEHDVAVPEEDTHKKMKEVKRGTYREWTFDPGQKQSPMPTQCESSL